MKKIIRIGFYTLSIMLLLGSFALWLSVVLRETQTLDQSLPAGGMRVDVGEMALHVTPTGNTADIPILLIHGTASWGEYWQETSKLLSENNYYALALDVPPFGYSDHAPNNSYSRVEQAARINAAVKKMNIKPIAVAHSFGASVTLEAVMREPENYAGLVIIAGAIGLNSHKDPPETLGFPASIPVVRRAGVALTSTNPLMTNRLIRSFVHDKSLDVSKYGEILKQPLRREGTTAAHADWFTYLLVPPKDALSTREPEIAKITLPTAIIWGDKDRVSPLSVGRKLHNLIENSTLDVMPNIGHIPQIENPDVFHDLLLTALAQISGGAN